VDVPIEFPPAPDPDPYRDPIALALLSEVYDKGEEASAGGITRRAGIAAADFRARYATLEDCALDCFERFIADYKRRVGIAFNSRSSWRDSLRAAAVATADFMEENPELVSFGMTGVLQLNSELARVRREETFVFCAELIDRGREEPGCTVGENEPAAMFAIGSIIQLLTYRLHNDEPVEAHTMIPEMMFAVVRSYLGEEVAREELEISAETGRASFSGRGDGVTSAPQGT
jgi:AcrR family transcriptional regulator